MTESVKGFVVSLEKDIREDDVEYIVNAIKMIKGVQSVSLNVVNSDDYLNRTRIKYRLEDKLVKAVRDVFESAKTD